MTYHIRNEYKSAFGRQRLTLWSGAFCSDYEGEATELPGRKGFMVEVNSRKIRVLCPAPRNDTNYADVDAAINAAIVD